ncbi:MAG TPA: histidine triad nucleotide-binding protein [Gemmatimonadales bacterium]|nr:histidine triad nucleotide-binding protein [Gemmatimonadales bacterium]
MTDCIFCRIASGEIPATIVDRTDEAVAFRDLDPKAPTHVLVIPVRHVSAARNATGEEGARLLGHLVQLATRVARAEGLDAGGYRLVSNTGPDAGQSVDHLHLHLLGGRRMTWPPG